MENMLENRLNKILAFINNGYIADLETGIVYSYSRGYKVNKLKERGCICKTNGYVKISTRINNKSITIAAHILIYYLATGKIVEEIDHKNRIRHDNRLDNLREVTHSENMRNASNVNGYSYDKKQNRYTAKIMVNRIKIELGSYKTKEEAQCAYFEAKEKCHLIGNEEQVAINVKEIIAKQKLSKPKKEKPKKEKIKRQTKGYYWCNERKKWRADIFIDGKKMHIGSYTIEEDVIVAVKIAREKYYIS